MSTLLCACAAHAIIIILLTLAQFANGGWSCGGVWLEDDSACVCGDTNITLRDSNTTDCCGRDTCYVKQNGEGTCPDGQLCKGGSTFRCGDIRIPDTGYCQCGEEKLTQADYNGEEILSTNISMASKRWCCASSSSSSCSFKDGIGICINGTVNKGTSCSIGFTYNGNNKNYKDYFYCENGQQVDRYIGIDILHCVPTEFCLGTPPICEDGSDLQQCQSTPICQDGPDKEHCSENVVSNPDYNKCPVTMKGSGHSQWFQAT